MKKNYISSKVDVQTFLANLIYILNGKQCKIQFQEERISEQNRAKCYSNNHAITLLFPSDDPIEALKKELKTLTTAEYIETVEDSLYPKRSPWMVFGRIYKQKHEIYIKIRAELLPAPGNPFGSYVFIMSFHLSTIPFAKCSFPYQ